MLSTANLFADNMVLQRQKPIPVWGKTDPDTVVSVALLNCDGFIVSCNSCVSDHNGNWRTILPAMEMARDVSMQIRSPYEMIEYRNVLCGEVWLAGGQSNMEYFLYFDAGKTEELKKPEIPDIRFFDCRRVSFEGADDRYDYSEFGLWRRCDPENLPWFSAVGYYFAARLQEALGIPVGIVGCNWGGTPACAWMEESYLEGTPGEVWLREYYDSIRGLNEAHYREVFCNDPDNIPNHPIPGAFPQLTYPGLDREEQLTIMQQPVPQKEYADLIGPCHPWRPCGLYHTMLSKIAPFSVRGVLWYQGSSDDKHPEIYDTVLSNLIANWRMLWQDELPFLAVQLAPFEAWLGCTGVHYPILRACQEKVAREIPGVYLCSNSDGGMRWDIHPKQKRPVGERLALLARGHIYNEDILCDGPRYAGHTRQGNCVHIRFANAQGLHLIDEHGSKCMEGIVGGLGIYGRVQGDTLIVSYSEKSKLEFANTDYYKVNLYNEANIPAFPFVAGIGEE